MTRPARSLLALIAVTALTLAACGGAKTDGDPTFESGTPEVERIATEGDVEIPPHLLICGFHKNLSLPLAVTTYLDEGGLSLYDFSHDDAQLVTWMNTYPGGKAYKFRKGESGGAAKGIGRQVSEPCFGNGDEAKDVIRQAVIVRGGGADASEALHNVLRSGRSAHFVVDRDGHVFEALDPVHAAHVESDHANVAIYIAMVAPRRIHEWLPDVFGQGASEGLAGALAMTAGEVSGQTMSLAPPPDVFAERERCTVAGETFESEVYTPEQEIALRALLYALTDEYPNLKLETMLGPDGVMYDGYAEDSVFHPGVLVDYQTRQDTREPACLDLERILSE